MNANPLIKDDPRSTIQAAAQYLRWMISTKAQDAEADPGELLGLQVVSAALDSLDEKK